MTKMPIYGCLANPHELGYFGKVEATIKPKLNDPARLRRNLRFNQ